MKWTWRTFANDDPRPYEYFRLISRIKPFPHFDAAIDQLLQRADGQFRAIVFDNMNWGSLHDLEQSGEYDGLWINDAIDKHHAEDGDHPQMGLEVFLQQFLSASKDHIAISEDRWAKPDVTPADWPESSRVISGGVLLFYLQAANATSTTIQDFVWDTRGRWRIGICTGFTDSRFDGQWTAEALTNLADSSSHVFCPAFDGDGYIVWTRNG